MFRTVRLKAGEWRTVESLWAESATAFFRSPERAQVRVFYGLGRLSTVRQTQMLDGEHYAKVSVRLGSFAYARIQMMVPRDTTFTYDIYPGPLVVRSPAIAF